jgi:AsmA protein
MKRILKIGGIVVVVLILIIIAIPFFIDANAFRPKLETELTGALGRDVKVGNLSLSLFQGGVSADNISIADDSKFSKSPFVQAKSLKVGVEMMPLIFSKTLNVTELTLDQPEISLVKSENGEAWNFSSLGSSAGSGPESKTAAPTQPAPSAPSAKPAQPSTPALAQPAASSSASVQPNLSVAKLNITNGRLTVSRAGSSDKPRVYDKVNIEVKNFSFSSAFPFRMTADTPAGGSLKLAGNAGPINAGNAEQTPLEAKITVEKMNLAASGFIDPAAGIAGIANLDGTVTSDGHQAKVNGALDVTNLQVVQKGSPAGRPVKLTFAVVHDLAKQTGELSQGDVAMGKAIAHLTGTYDAHTPVTSVNLKLNGQGMPVDELEAMLPAVGVVLPPKATLKGGTLNLAMATEGAVDKLVTTGTVRLENTELANFNLGSKLAAVSALSGKNTGNDTKIQNFSTDVRNSPQGTQATNLNLTIPSIGVVTGAGTVSPSNQLAFKMKADVGGMGVPFGVTGTASDPKFTPDVAGIATGLLQGVLSGQTPGQGKPGQQPNPVDSLTGLFKKKPK